MCIREILTLSSRISSLTQITPRARQTVIQCKHNSQHISRYAVAHPARNLVSTLRVAYWTCHRWPDQSLPPIFRARRLPHSERHLKGTGTVCDLLQLSAKTLGARGAANHAVYARGHATYLDLYLAGVEMPQST